MAWCVRTTVTRWRDGVEVPARLCHRTYETNFFDIDYARIKGQSEGKVARPSVWR